MQACRIYVATLNEGTDAPKQEPMQFNDCTYTMSCYIPEVPSNISLKNQCPRFYSFDCGPLVFLGQTCRRLSFRVSIWTFVTEWFVIGKYIAYKKRSFLTDPNSSFYTHSNQARRETPAPIIQYNHSLHCHVYEKQWRTKGFRRSGHVKLVLALPPVRS
jgi:hypothetical protein